MGKNINQDRFVFIIPARMESSRFPGKPLEPLGGKPVIDWVYENCKNSVFCEEAYIATDSDQIVRHCQKTNKKCIPTGKQNCASDRVAEASLKISTEWIVEVQGDEPLLWSEIIDAWLNKSLKYRHKNEIDLFLSIAKLSQTEADNPNFVKIIRDVNGKLQWVSRSRIPNNLKKPFGGEYFRHSGFHLWRKESLINFSQVKPSLIEESEDTHATRIVENNFVAQTIELPDTQAIDNPEDISKAELILQNLGKRNG